MLSVMMISWNKWNIIFAANFELFRKLLLEILYIISSHKSTNNIEEL